MDVLSTEQIIGHEIKSAGLERVVLPDTTRYIEENNGLASKESATTNAIFPKYNNYVKNPLLFDRTSKFFAPLNLLGIRLPAAGTILSGRPTRSVETQRSVISYAIYRTAGDILPQSFENNLKQRYGVDLTLPSTLLAMAGLTADGQIISSLSDGPSIKYKIRVDYVNQRANPQCVHWKVTSGKGAWSREGCRTDFHDPWFYDQEDFHVNCTCSSLGPVAVAMNKEEFMVIDPLTTRLRHVLINNIFSL